MEPQPYQGIGIYIVILPQMGFTHFPPTPQPMSFTHWPQTTAAPQPQPGPVAPPPMEAPQPMSFIHWPQPQPTAPLPQPGPMVPPPMEAPQPMSFIHWPQPQPTAPLQQPVPVAPPPMEPPQPMSFTHWPQPQPTAPLLQPVPVAPPPRFTVRTQPQPMPPPGVTNWPPPQQMPEPPQQMPLWEPKQLPRRPPPPPPPPISVLRLLPPRPPPPPPPMSVLPRRPPPPPPRPFLPPMLPPRQMGSTNGSPPMGFTENNSLTYLSTSNPCLDLFFHVVPDTNSDSLTGMLKKSWDHNSLTTLKLISNLRGVRGTGKSDKENFYTAALWLHQHHPKTLAYNVGFLAEFGYFKDLPEILFRLLEGPKVRSTAKSEWWLKKNRKGKGSRCRFRKMYFSAKRKKSQMGRKQEKKTKKLRAQVPSEQRIEANVEKVKVQREKARVLRKERELAKAKKASERYTSDPDFRFLHDKISEVFAEHLRLDIQCLKTGEINKISLAAKWCPSIDSSYDKSTLIFESIAKRVFPPVDYEEYIGIEEAHYLYRVRDRLRKEVLVPLHKALELPEVYMSEKHWDTLPYKRVASVAMKNYKNIFLQRDNKRFKGYLEDVKSGKAKISAGALLPHEIIASLKGQDGGKVAELQWARMVEDLTEKGKLRNCIAVCDVSSSMNGTPMEVCVALGLLISELSEDPWKGKVITFSANPQLHKVEGDSLLEKTQFVKEMEWGGNTDFQKVFNRILKIAVDGKLSEEQMIKKIFVFSDMEFDQASRNVPSYSYYWHPKVEDSESGSDTEVEDSIVSDPGCSSFGVKVMNGGRPIGWKTDYEVIQRKFQKKGYKVPEIVFWNLRHSPSTPVTAKQSGVALVSGFSKNMVTMFLEEDGIVNPEAVMEKAISGELYQKLVVHD